MWQAQRYPLLCGRQRTLRQDSATIVCEQEETDDGGDETPAH